MLDNEGTISIDLSATADASEGAAAFAILREGIGQEATGLEAPPNWSTARRSVLEQPVRRPEFPRSRSDRSPSEFTNKLPRLASLANFGEIELTAGGVADGGHAVAGGLVGTAVGQELDGSAPQAIFSNAGELLVDAHATASASANGSDYDAIAQAVDLGGIVQSISGGGGDARFTNATSRPDIDRRRREGGSDERVGHRRRRDRVWAAGDRRYRPIGRREKLGATAEISNAGLISIAIGASAVADGSAFAQMTADYIVLQQVHGHTAASAILTNSGTIAAHGSATATGGADALALARIDHGISQSVTAAVSSSGRGPVPPTSAIAKLDNIGLISLAANAHAVAGSIAEAAATIVHRHRRRSGS